MELSSFFFFGIIFLLNLVRFLGLDFSPPGFYVDEAVGAAQVLCIKQTGADFFNQAFPLFSHGLGGGYYSAPYLYGQALFTSLFGNSIYSFRAFIALASFLTIALLYAWAKKLTNERTARFVLLFASISPWAFQFSRIAWDPPLAPLFIILGLIAFQTLKKIPYFWGALCFAVAAYAYPPTRIQAFAFLFLIPHFSWKEKLKALAVWFMALLPLFYCSLDPEFTMRGKMLVLWSSYSGNPYHDANTFGLIGGFFSQLAQYFMPEFLIGSGDHNLRHSIQTFGMLSYPEALFLGLGVLAFVWMLVTRKSFTPEKKLFLMICGVGLITGLSPGALTWEGNPHALRAIGAWPFFVCFAAFSAEALTRKKYLKECVLVLSLVFSGFYFYSYFESYPERANAWFQTETVPVAQAYQKMTVFDLSCKDIRP